MDQTIKNLLKETGLFADFDEQQFEHLLANLNVVEFSANHVFIKEGEKADSCYIVADGVCQAFTHDHDEKEVILDRIEKGAFVGEQALMGSKVGYRSNSVRTMVDSRLIRIDHSVFREILKLDKILKAKLEEVGLSQLLHNLQKLPSLFEFEQDVFNQIDLSKSKVERFEADDTILQEGDSSAGVHLVVSGIVQVYKKNKLGVDEKITQLEKGALLGEAGVIKSSLRNASAKAHTAVQTVFIDADSFRKLYLGNPQLERIINTLQKTYSSPQRGVAHQYTSDFLGMKAVITDFQLPDGRKIHAATVIGKNIRSIHEQPRIEALSTHYQQDDSISRELFTHNNRLVGVVCYGEWEHLDSIYNMVFDQLPISFEQLEHFKKHGEILLPPLEPRLVPDDPNKICCKCLRVTRGQIVNCINCGLAKVELIRDEIGAGSICGYCVPQISKILVTFPRN